MMSTRTKLTFLISPIITTLFLLSIYYMKSIYPFSSRHIMWGDMHQINTPLFYAFYDIFKGQGSVLYNHNSALGMNFYGVFFFFLSSPVNFILLLFPREDIYMALSIVLLVKMMLISCTSYYFFNRYFTVSLFYKILFSLLYTFSSYVLILHTNIMWLDNVYLFPLLLITLKNLYDQNKILGYIILLTMNIVVSFYIAYMILFFIFFSSIIYFSFYVKKEERGKKLCLLGLGTITSLLLSSVVLIPTYLQIKSSSRLSHSLVETLMHHNGFIMDKISFLLMSSFVFALTILARKQLKNNRHVVFLSILLSMTLIQILFDSVNKIWHTGSYKYFPLRYGFIPLFLLLLFGLMIIQDIKIETLPMRKNIRFNLFIIPIILCVLFYDHFELTQEILVMMRFIKNYWYGFYIFFRLVLISILFIYAYYLIFKYTTNHKLKISLISLFLIMQIFINQSYYIGIGKPEISEAYQSALKVQDYFKTINSKGRVKDLIFNNNASFVYNLKTAGHYTSLTSETYMKQMKSYGYSSIWVRTFDNGGTLFTDSLLGYQYVLSSVPLDETLYEFVDEIDKNTYLYQIKNYLPVGFLVDDAFKNFQMNKTSLFTIQNGLYQFLMKSDQTLIDSHLEFTYRNIEKTTKAGMMILKKQDIHKKAYAEITIPSNGNKALYLSILNSLNNEENIPSFFSFKVYINDIPFDTNIPSRRYTLMHKYEPDSNVFPQRLENGLLSLGRYDKPVKIKLELLRNEVTLKEFTIGSLDIELYQDFIKQYQKQIHMNMKKNRIEISVNEIEENKMLYLSIPYDKGYSAIVNGDVIKLNKIMGNFIGIELKQGDNKILIQYIPPGLKLGLFISLITLTIMIFGSLIKNRILNLKDKWYQYFYFGFIGVYIIGLIVVYIIPILIEIYSIL